MLASLAYLQYLSLLTSLVTKKTDKKSNITEITSIPILVTCKKYLYHFAPFYWHISYKGAYWKYLRFLFFAKIESNRKKRTKYDKNQSDFFRFLFYLKVFCFREFLSHLWKLFVWCFFKGFQSHTRENTFEERLDYIP